VSRANDLNSLSVGGAFDYRGRLFGFGLTSDLYAQSQDAEDAGGNVFEQSTSRAALGASLRRFFGSRWALQASGNWEQNEELSLDSRAQFGAQALYDFIENQGLEARAGVGLVNNTERYEGTDTETSAEVQAGISFDVFDVGDVDMSALLVTYSSLGETGRVRTTLDFRLAWEFVDDFNLVLNVKERFDSEPPVAGALKRDYQYGLALGITWG
jgi:hypothetical protein